MRFVSGWPPPFWSSFCRLVGREAEADAWAASRWSGLATTAGEGGEGGEGRGQQRDTGQLPSSGRAQTCRQAPGLLTGAGGALQGGGHAVGSVLCDGLDRKLVMTHRRLLHDGNGLQGPGGLAALDEATGRS